MLNTSLSWGLTGLVTVTTLLGACGGAKGLETCKVVEIEEAEVELDVTDVDIERGEVEMVCGDDIVDVTWGEFEKKVGVNPKDYFGDETGFKAAFGGCLIDTSSKKKEIQCQKLNDSDYVPVKFSYDD